MAARDDDAEARRPPHVVQVDQAGNQRPAPAEFHLKIAPQNAPSLDQDAKALLPRHPAPRLDFTKMNIPFGAEAKRPHTIT